MNQFRVAIGALLLAAPVFSQAPPAADPRIQEGRVDWFLLTETRQEVSEKLGLPRMIAAFGQDFESWQYQIDNLDEEFSHQLVFRKSDHSLVSITRNYDPERNLDALFPESESRAYFHPGPTPYPFRVRRLSGGRILLAAGISKAGQVTGQVTLIRESELRFFYPWLFDALTASAKQPDQPQHGSRSQ